MLSPVFPGFLNYPSDFAFCAHERGRRSVKCSLTEIQIPPGGGRQCWPHRHDQHSVFIHGVMVFSSSLHAVAAVAERLPVAPVPEQYRVASMRNDMINVCRFHIAIQLQALFAKRVCLQIFLPGFPPFISVAAFCS